MVVVTVVVDVALVANRLVHVGLVLSAESEKETDVLGEVNKAMPHQPLPALGPSNVTPSDTSSEKVLATGRPKAIKDVDTNASNIMAPKLLANKQKMQPLAVTLVWPPHTTRCSGL